MKAPIVFLLLSVVVVGLKATTPESPARRLGNPYSHTRVAPSNIFVDLRLMEFPPILQLSQKTWPRRKFWELVWTT